MPQKDRLRSRVAFQDNALQAAPANARSLTADARAGRHLPRQNSEQCAVRIVMSSRPSCERCRSLACAAQRQLRILPSGQCHHRHFTAGCGVTLRARGRSAFYSVWKSRSSSTPYRRRMQIGIELVRNRTGRLHAPDLHQASSSQFRFPPQNYDPSRFPAGEPASTLYPYNAVTAGEIDQ